MQTLHKTLLLITLCLMSIHLNAENPKTGRTYYLEGGVGDNHRFLQIQERNLNHEAVLNVDDFTQSFQQKFTLQDAGDGWFNILSEAWGGKLIYVYGGKSKSRAKVDFWSSLDEDNLKWRFLSAGDGHFYIQSKQGTFLEVQNPNSAKKPQVWLHEINNGKAQKWKLHDITESLRFIREYQMDNFGSKCMNTMENHYPYRNLNSNRDTELNVDMNYSHDGQSIYATVKMTIGKNGFSRRGNDIQATWSEKIFTASPEYKIKGFNPMPKQENAELLMKNSWHDKRTGMILPKAGSNYTGINDAGMNTFENDSYTITIAREKDANAKGDHYNCSCDAKLADINFKDFLVELELQN